MNEDVKSAAHEVAESAKELAGKLENLAKVAATQAEPFVEEAIAKIRELADKAEAALHSHKTPQA
jgi:ElaB/YqjD/DUF883 family membrane-anchored ribosome-binding protein